jgi:hypothetical protein
MVWAVLDSSMFAYCARDGRGAFCISPSGAGSNPDLGVMNQ